MVVVFASRAAKVIVVVICTLLLICQGSEGTESLMERREWVLVLSSIVLIWLAIMQV